MDMHSREQYLDTVREEYRLGGQEAEDEAVQ
jgi:hypothetical protein